MCDIVTKNKEKRAERERERERVTKETMENGAFDLLLSCARRSRIHFYVCMDNGFGYSDVGFASDMKHINSEIVEL